MISNTVHVVRIAAVVLTIIKLVSTFLAAVGIWLAGSVAGLLPTMPVWWPTFGLDIACILIWPMIQRSEVRKISN